MLKPAPTVSVSELKVAVSIESHLLKLQQAVFSLEAVLSDAKRTLALGGSMLSGGMATPVSGRAKRPPARG